MMYSKLETSMKKHDHKDWEDDSQGGGEEGSQTGSGGKSGEIGFRIQTEIFRDDLLHPAEIRRLLQVHSETHKAYVNKQKQLRKERIALKENRKSATAQYRAGFGGSGGQVSRYKKHPISAKAQFSGIDKQVTALPTENEADTNAKLRDELENRYNYRFQPTRQFNPKPRPY
jgi:hypothetical protein